MRVKKSLGFGDRFSHGMQLSMEAARLSELHDVAVSSEYFSNGHQRSALQVNPELRRLGPLKLRHATKQINCGKQPPLSTSLKMWLNLGKNLDLRPFSTFNEVTFDTELPVSLGWICHT
jgi:hypothetical protein